MRRITLLNCLLGLLTLGPATRGLADGVAPPQRPILPQCRVLEGLVGTWDTQLSSGSAEVLGKPRPIGRTTRQWVADHKFVHERGNEHEAYITFYPPQNMYRAWYFHSNGHVWTMAGQWTGNMTMLSLSAEMDQNQSMQRHFQVLDDKSHECTVAWTDEDGRNGTYGIFNYTRCDPASVANTGKASASIQPKPTPSAEMQIFADDIGKWTVEGSVTNGETTTKVNGSSVVQWILGGRFVQTTTKLQGREGEGIGIAGYDTATKTYRCWFFDAGGIYSEPGLGVWDEKTRTMAWKQQMTSDIAMVSKKQWINHDIAKSHAVFTRQNGAIETTRDVTITRQKDK